MLQTHFFHTKGHASDFSIPEIVVNDKEQLIVVFNVGSDQKNELVKKIQKRVAEVTITSPSSLYSFVQRLVEMLETIPAEISCGWFGHNKVALCAWNADVYLKRQDKTGRILQAGNDIKIIEGPAHNSDIYLLTTRSASAVFTQQLPEIIQEIPVPQAIIEALQPKIQKSALSDRSAIGIVLLQVVSEGKEEEPQQPAKQTVTPQTKTPTALSQNTQSITQQQEKKRRSIPVGNIVRAVISKISSLSKGFGYIRKSFFSKDTYINQANSRKILQKMLPIFGFVAVIFVILVFQVFNRRRQSAVADTFLEPLQANIQQAKNNFETNPIQTRDTIIQTIPTIDEKSSEFENQKYAYKKIMTFREETQEYFDSISGSVEVSVLDTFFDFRLVQPDFIATYASLNGTIGVFTDIGKKSSITLDLETKQAKTIPIGEYDTIKHTYADDDMVYILSDGIYEFPINSQNPATKIIEEGDSNRDAKFISSFGSYLYVFNPEKRNIYRYAPSADGYSDPIGWLSNKQGIEFGTITSFVIDGSIWLGTNNGTIHKLESGQPVEFNLRGLPSQFEGSLQLFTKEDFENVYVLETQKGRVVVLNKEGEFQKEISSPNLSAATDLIVKEDIGKAFVVAGSLIYEVDLSQ